MVDTLHSNIFAFQKASLKTVIVCTFYHICKSIMNTIEIFEGHLELQCEVLGVYLKYFTHFQVGKSMVIE